ncbi:MAG: hypothetical protein IT423_12360, partial [Pirellulaceae bacterium]|nr:hypothetical protein [Pirellulaceae bacterium]
MRGTFLLAYRYMTFHRGRTLILVLAVGLTLFLPLATHWTIEKFRDRAFHRAAATPLVVGSKGSRFGLAMHALYFRGESPSSLPMSQLTRIDTMELGKTIPMLVNFRAGGFPIVGTTDEYLRFRDLKLSVGQPMSRLGDCLLGANVARSLELNVGDRLQSEPENMFDITGPSPLSMRVTGVLMSTSTADDDVVLCDLKTAWIIQGIGHGHAIAETKADERVVPESGDQAQHKHAASRENMQA